MTWEAIGSTGEWAAAIAVVATLFYLARQITHQNKYTNISMHDSIFGGFNEINSMLAASDVLSELFLTGLHRPDQLTDAQASQFHWMFRLYFNNYFKLYRIYQQGLLPKEDWIGNASQGAWFLGTPGGKIFREGHGDAFSDVFEAILAERMDAPTADITLGRKDHWEESDKSRPPAN